MTIALKSASDPRPPKIRELKMHYYRRASNCFDFFSLQRLALASALIGMPTIATALDIHSITSAEMAMLPRYCAYTGTSPGRNTPEGKRWASLLGEQSFSNIHHYCWGLISLQRAMRSSTSPGQRLFLLSTVTDDFEYSIRGSAKGFALLPELLTRNGEVYLRRSLPNEANKSFAQARALKPDYWPAYSGWVEFLIYSGKKAEAKRLIEAGLKYSPNAKVLREQYRLLNSNLPETAVITDKRPPSSTAEASTPPQAPQRPTDAETTNDTSTTSSAK